MPPCAGHACPVAPSATSLCSLPSGRRRGVRQGGHLYERCLVRAGEAHDLHGCEAPPPATCADRAESVLSGTARAPRSRPASDIRTVPVVPLVAGAPRVQELASAPRRRHGRGHALRRAQALCAGHDDRPGGTGHGDGSVNDRGGQALSQPWHSGHWARRQPLRQGALPPSARICESGRTNSPTQRRLDHTELLVTGERGHQEGEAAALVQGVLARRREQTVRWHGGAAPGCADSPGLVHPILDSSSRFRFRSVVLMLRS